MLSHAQAMEVAKRFNPAAEQTLWFDDTGSLLSAVETRRAVAEQKGEVYVCRRVRAGDPVEVARVTDADLATDPEADPEDALEPGFGEAW